MAFSERLWSMADLYTPMALRVAATLRLAEHVAAGAGTVPELAESTGADAGGLERLVAHLVSTGVLARGSDGALSLTDIGEELRDQGAWLDMDGAIGRADLSATDLLHAVRTGEPAYPVTYGVGFWEELAASPALAESYDALMGSRLDGEAAQIAAAYDWSALGHVVDVGGGNGALLAALLTAHPRLRGTLVDLPGAAEAGRERFAAAGLADRCDVAAGSFFDALPAGADAYVLSGVLHGFADDDALAILARCTEAGAGRVLIIEEGAEDGPLRTEQDLRMFAYTGGRERTLEDFERLAARAGLRVAGTHPATRHRTIIDLR